MEKEFQPDAPTTMRNETFMGITIELARIGKSFDTALELLLKATEEDKTFKQGEK